MEFDESLFQMEIKLFETSAKENINVEEMFRAITDLVLKSKKDQQERLNNQVSGPLNLFVFVSATKWGAVFVPGKVYLASLPNTWE